MLCRANSYFLVYIAVFRNFFVGGGGGGGGGEEGL